MPNINVQGEEHAFSKSAELLRSKVTEEDIDCVFFEANIPDGIDPIEHIILVNEARIAVATAFSYTKENDVKTIYSLLTKEQQAHFTEPQLESTLDMMLHGGPDKMIARCSAIIDTMKYCLENGKKVIPIDMPGITVKYAVSREGMDERNQHMAQIIQKTKFKNAVAFVGDAHVEPISARLKDTEGLEVTVTYVGDIASVHEESSVESGGLSDFEDNTVTDPKESTTPPITADSSTSTSYTSKVRSSPGRSKHSKN